MVHGEGSSPRLSGTLQNHPFLPEKRDRYQLPGRPALLIHQEEVLKLQQKGFLQRNTEGMVRSRIRITYSPKLGIATLRETSTADQVSLQTRKYV